MRGMKRQAFLVLVLVLLCVHFLTLCCGLQAGQPGALATDPIRPQFIIFNVDIAQNEQPGDYAVKPNENNPRPNSSWTLKQSQYFLATVLLLILLALIGSYAAYPIKFNRSGIHITSLYLLRAPPKTA
jgi:hypothetical protein